MITIRQLAALRERAGAGRPEADLPEACRLFALFIYIYIYIYTHICMSLSLSLYIYIYNIHREREREICLLQRFLFQR